MALEKRCPSIEGRRYTEFQTKGKTETLINCDRKTKLIFITQGIATSRRLFADLCVNKTMPCSYKYTLLNFLNLCKIDITLYAYAILNVSAPMSLISYFLTESLRIDLSCRLRCEHNIEESNYSVL